MAAKSPAPVDSSSAHKRLLEGLEDDNLYMRDMMQTLSRGRWIIVASIVAALLIAIFWLKQQTPLYAATVTVAPVPSQVQSRSASSGLTSVLSSLNMTGAAEGDVSPFQEYQALLISPAVAQGLQQRYGFMQEVFDDRWDSINKRWIRPTGLRPAITGAIKEFLGFPAWVPPGIDDLVNYLGDNVRIVTVPDTSMRQIRVTDPDPKRAMWLLNALNREVDAITRREAVDRTTAQISYLDRKLATTTNVTHMEAIGRLITDQEQMLMLTQTEQPYAARVIGAPNVSDRPVSPRIPVAFAFAFLLGLIGGVVLVFISRALFGGDRKGANILLTAGEVAEQNSGMGVYAYELCRRMVPLLIARGYDVTVAARSDATTFIRELEGAGARLLLLGSSRGNALRRLFEQNWKVTRQGSRYSLVYSLDHKMPMLRGGMARILSLVDCCYRSFPQEHSRLRRFFFWLSHRSIGRRLDRVVTISRHAAQEIMRYYDVPRERIAIVQPGIELDRFAGAAVRNFHLLREKYGIQRPGYFLFLGRISPRKNFALIAEAFALLRAEGHKPHLVMAGPPGWRNEDDAKLAEARGVTSMMQSIGYAAPEDLPSLYHHAAALLYPSFCEGFGIPVLEALASGTHVIVARNTASQEVGGPFVYSIDPNSAAELAAAIRHAAQAPKQVGASEDVLRHVAQFDWDRAAEHAVDLIEGLVRDQRRPFRPQVEGADRANSGAPIF